MTPTRATQLHGEPAVSSGGAPAVSSGGAPAVSSGGAPAVSSGGRAAVTRRSLLAAAAQVFTSVGYSDASVADLVAAARGSVGSLYHHFGGKADLYAALFEDYHQRQESRSAEAVLVARSGGEHEPMALFLAGARAYLQGCWSERDLARMFHAGGGPPGFEVVSRRTCREWTRLNHSLLHVADDACGDALVLVLTTVVSEAGHEVALQDDEPAATLLIDNVLGLVAKIGAP